MHNSIIEIINQVGFPIFVAIWMLVKDQSEKKQTREVLNGLKEAINSLKEKMRCEK
jgi:hypothetical protein